MPANPFVNLEQLKINKPKYFAINSKKSFSS
jgi:hypothetical protein